MPSPTTVLLRTQTDERLVALVQAGHERAFEAIVERYRKPLLRACRRLLPEARAEDAVQQALVAAWTGLTRGDEVRELRPWLYRIARNTALNQLRVAGYDYDELHEMLRGGPAPDEELDRRLIAQRTLVGLAALPERQREALLQIAVQGRGQEEVAREMGLSEPAVRQLVHRARVTLRSAATALTPMPLAAWAAAAGAQGGGIAEIVAGGGGAAGAATVAKVAAVVALAGGAAATPVVVDHARPDGARPERAEAAAAPRAATVKEDTAPKPTPAATTAADDDHGGHGSDDDGGGDRHGGSGSSGRSGDDDGEDGGTHQERHRNRGGDDDDAEPLDDSDHGGGERSTSDELDTSDDSGDDRSGSGGESDDSSGGHGSDD